MELDKALIIKEMKNILKAEIIKINDDNKKFNKNSLGFECKNIQQLETKLINEALIIYYDTITNYIFNNNTLYNRNEMIKVLFSFSVKQEIRKIINDIYTQCYYKLQITTDLNIIEYILKKFKKRFNKLIKLLTKSMDEKYKST